jgi:DNA polymerase-3 subunit delta
MVKGALKKLLDETLPTRDPMNSVSLDMGVSTLLELSNECLALPLGYGQKAVVAENCFFLAKTSGKIKMPKNDDAAPLLSFFGNPDPNILLYLLVYSEELDERSPFYQALVKGQAKMNPVSQFSEGQWKSFIPRFFEKRNVKIDSAAVDELLERIGGDYAQFLNEAQKLIAYAGCENVTVEMVDILVAPPLEDDVFQLSNALTRSDNRKALAIYKDLKTRAVDPIPLINLLTRQFSFMDQVAFLSAQGQNNAAIALKLKCSSGRVNATQYSLRKIKKDSLGKALEGLYAGELAILTGKEDPDLVFSLYLANFSL